MGRGFVSIAGAAALAGVLLGCKTITEELPTRPTDTTPTVTVPIPVVVTPVPIPQPQPPAPAPQATPSPSAPQTNPTPTPATSPTPDNDTVNVVGQSCAPAPAPGNERCPVEGSGLLDALEAALDQLIAERPTWFRREDGSDQLVGVDEKTYDWALIDVLRRRGYCAGFYAEEISVRRSPEYSENFDVLTSSHGVRRGPGAYRSTCHPASTTEE